MNALTVKDVSFSKMTSHADSREYGFSSIFSLNILYKELISLHVSK
jgi:hypothetical protein